MRSCVCRGRARGFTLVEVLIVVAVLAALMMLLLPALQSVRSAARRTDCGNNLRQLALAVTSFHNRNGVMPPFWGSHPRRVRLNVGSGASGSPVHTSWLGHILPDLDMQTEYLRLPKAKICLGYRRFRDVPGGVRSDEFLPTADAVTRTELDGITFNIHNPVGEGSFEGNVVNSSVSSGSAWVPGGQANHPVFRYDRVLETSFAANGMTYNVWRYVPVQIGTVPVTIAGYWQPTYTGLAEPRYGLGTVTRDGRGYGGTDGYTTPYFNLSGSTPYGKGYPAAQETISVPIRVCKGDNSVIESSQKLRWLGGNDWSTTNYLANPHAFAEVSAREAMVTTNDAGEQIAGVDYDMLARVRPGDSDRPGPLGTGRYRIRSWKSRSFDHIKDGQANTILLSEAMRYCSTVAFVAGQAFPDTQNQNRYIDMARLAFWSSPNLSTVVDMWSGSTSGQDLRALGDGAGSTSAVFLAIQPHPKWAGVPGNPSVSNGQQTYVSMPVPPDVSWKPWTHNFGVEWERYLDGGPEDRESRRHEYANTFMFQPQPKPEECSAIRAQSNHGDTLMVAMCDGSVRPISSSISRREVSDAQTDGKVVGRFPNMGSGVDGTTGKSTQPDGAWDMLMKANDGLTPPSE